MDASPLQLHCQVKRVVLNNGSDLYLAWVTRLEGPEACHTLYEMTALDDACGLSQHGSHSVLADVVPAAASAAGGAVPERTVFSQAYQLVEEIGSGSFGSVHLAVNSRSGKTAVVKFIDKSKGLFCACGCCWWCGMWVWVC